MYICFIKCILLGYEFAYILERLEITDEKVFRRKKSYTEFVCFSANLKKFVPKEEERGLKNFLTVSSKKFS